VKRTVEKRIQVESSQLQERTALEHFLRLFANEIAFSDLRPVRENNPDVELAQLFDELVGVEITDAEDEKLAGLIAGH